MVRIILIGITALFFLMEVRDHGLWGFSHDEGYVFACRAGSQYGFAIYAESSHAGNEPIANRPELLAMYNWLRQNVGYY